jgi:hypothetical protein
VAGQTLLPSFLKWRAHQMQGAANFLSQNLEKTALIQINMDFSGADLFDRINQMFFDYFAR